ncbi:MAG TPA: PHP domain-containing protein [Acidaminococcaceae bacterium]|nr:PHP domain-containing protein [Acidaminococcaceae bacterium]
MRADLHIHTTASDGTWDPAQVIAAVCAEGIEVFAISDHDSVANVTETKKLAEGAGLQFIAGVELNATKDGHNYHILGYGIDITNKTLLELCRHNQGLLERKDDDSIQNLIARGWPLSMEEFTEYSYDPHRGGWKALAYLQDKQLCGDVNDFFRRIFTAENDLGFPDFPSVSEVVKVIHQAGGLALCAHLASDFHGAGMQEYLPRLVGEELDGFECYHSGHSAEDSRLLAHFCRRHKLCISGGSDCHGSFVPSRHLGIPVIDTDSLYLPVLQQ